MKRAGSGWLSNLVNYSIDDGLPSSQIYGFTKDDNGLLWMGTDNGLCLFDSEETEVFTTKDGLPENVILELKKDANGKIWGKTLSGHFFNIDPETKKVTRTSLRSQLESACACGVTFNWIPDSNSTIWFSTWKPTKKEYRTNTFYFFKYNQEEGLTELEDYQSDSSQFILKRIGNDFICGYNKYGTGSGFNQAYILKDSSALAISTMLPAWPESNRFEFLVQSDSSILISVNNALFRITPSLSVTGPFKFPAPIGELAESSNGYIYVGLVGKKGLWQFSKYDHTFSHGTQLLDGVTTSSLWFAENGGMFMGTSNKGFYHQPMTPFWAKNPPTAVPTTITKMRSFGGRVLLINGLTTGYELSQNVNLVWSFTKKIHRSKGISDFWLIDSNYMVSPSERNNAITWTDHSSKRNVSASGAQLNIPWTQNRIIGCHSYGFALANYESGWHYQSSKNAVKPENRFNSRVLHALPLDSQSFLIGSTNGAYRIENLKVHPFQQQNITQNTRINRIIRGPENYIWLASNTDGVFISDLEEGFFKHISQFKKQELGRVSTLATVKNQIWIGTKNGLGLVENASDPDSFRLRMFDKADGLPSKEILDLAVYQNRWLVINTSAGIAILDAQNVPPAKTSFELFERRLLVNGEDFNLEPNHRLQSTQNSLRFSYGCRHYGVKSPQYWYRLVNQDSTWTQTGESQLYFSNQASDAYKLQISSVPRYEEGKSLQYEFVIEKPFTQTTLFFALVAVAILLIFAVTTGIIYGRLKLRNQLVESQQTALISQMNPHFIFNTLNSIQYYVGESGQSKAHQYLSHFSRLIRRVLDSSTTGSIRLDEEIETLEQYVELEKLRFEERIHVHFEVKPEVIRISGQTFIPSMVIQPFIENAIVHGLSTKAGGGNLWVLFTYAHNELCITVKDDGVGRQASKKHKASQQSFKKKSIGTSNTLNRIKLLNKAQKANIRINITDVTPSGTLVEIRITLPNGNFKSHNS